MAKNKNKRILEKKFKREQKRNIKLFLKDKNDDKENIENDTNNEKIIIEHKLIEINNDANGCNEQDESLKQETSVRKKFFLTGQRQNMKIKRRTSEEENLEDEEEDNDIDVEKESTDNGFSKKMLLKLMTSCNRTQKYYNDFRNTLNQYPLLKFKSNNTGDTYSYKNKVVLKVTVFPKALKIYFGLDPKKYDINKYHHKNVKTIKKYETIPLLIRIGSDRSYKYALDLLKSLIKKINITKTDCEIVDYMKEFITSSKDLLIAFGGEEYLKESCTKEQSSVIPDALAKKCVILENKELIKGDKIVGEVSIGELSIAFKSTYNIDLQLLKDVGLVDKNVNYLKINAMNNCYKAINIKADEYEPEVINMVVITGGNIIKLVN